MAIDLVAFLILDLQELERLERDWDAKIRRAGELGGLDLLPTDDDADKLSELRSKISAEPGVRELMKLCGAEGEVWGSAWVSRKSDILDVDHGLASGRMTIPAFAAKVTEIRHTKGPIVPPGDFARIMGTLAEASEWAAAGNTAIQGYQIWPPKASSPASIRKSAASPDSSQTKPLTERQKAVRKRRREASKLKKKGFTIQKIADDMNRRVDEGILNFNYPVPITVDIIKQDLSRERTVD